MARGADSVGLLFNPEVGAAGGHSLRVPLFRERDMSIWVLIIHNCIGEAGARESTAPAAAHGFEYDISHLR